MASGNRVLDKLPLKSAPAPLTHLPKVRHFHQFLPLYPLPYPLQHLPQHMYMHLHHHHHLCPLLHTPMHPRILNNNSHQHLLFCPLWRQLSKSRNNMSD